MKLTCKYLVDRMLFKYKYNNRQECKCFFRHYEDSDTYTDMLTIQERTHKWKQKSDY